MTRFLWTSIDVSELGDPYTHVLVSPDERVFYDSSGLSKEAKAKVEAEARPGEIHRSLGRFYCRADLVRRCMPERARHRFDEMTEERLAIARRKRSRGVLAQLGLRR